MLYNVCACFTNIDCSKNISTNLDCPLGDAIVMRWCLSVTEEQNKGKTFPFLSPWRRKRWWEQCIASLLKAQISILIIKLKLSACSEVRDFSFMFPFGVIPSHSGIPYFPDFKVQSFTGIMSLAFLIHKFNAISSPCLWDYQLLIPKECEFRALGKGKESRKGVVVLALQGRWDDGDHKAISYYWALPYMMQPVPETQDQDFLGTSIFWAPSLAHESKAEYLLCSL